MNVVKVFFPVFDLQSPSVDFGTARSKLSQSIHRTPYMPTAPYLPDVFSQSLCLTPSFPYLAEKNQSAKNWPSTSPFARTRIPVNNIPAAHASSLADPAPHILQQPVPLAQAVQRIVTLAHGAHEAAQRVDLVLARVPSVLVDLSDGDLYGSVVFGFDDAVGGAALAGHVAGEGTQKVSSLFGGIFSLGLTKRGGLEGGEEVLTGRRARPCRSPWLRLGGVKVREKFKRCLVQRVV